MQGQKRSRRAKGEGCVRYHPTKKLWEATFEVGKDACGKRVRRTLYAKTRSELVRAVADERARGGGKLRPRATGTIRDFVARWLENDIKPNRAANTYALYETIWRVHIAPLIGALRLDKFGPDEAAALYVSLRQRGTSPSVLHRVGVLMHRVFAVAIRQRHYHQANPFDAIERPTYRSSRARSLTIEESRRFIVSAREDRFEALWILCLTAGLRIGEALALRWSDLNQDAGTLSVQQTLIEVGGSLTFSEPKTIKSRRNITLGDLARTALLRRLAAYDVESHGCGLMFSTLAGKPMRRGNLRRAHFLPLLRRADIGHIRIHDLRHSMTSLGIAAGVVSKVLADRLGHSTTRLTDDRYAHVLPGIDGGAAAAIDELLTAAITNA